MAFLIGKWYIEKADGTLQPCQNYKTAEYLVANTDAIRIVDVTRELMSR